MTWRRANASPFYAENDSPLRPRPQHFGQRATPLSCATSSFAQIFAHYSAMRLRKATSVLGPPRGSRHPSSGRPRTRAQPGHEASPGRRDKSRRSATTPAPLPHPQAARFAGIQLIKFNLPHTNAIRRIAPAACFSPSSHTMGRPRPMLFSCAISTVPP
jgi:hypothetical protein